MHVDNAIDRNEIDYGFIINIEDEDVVRVTMPYSILFVKQNIYKEICNALEKEYTHGAESYMNLVGLLSSSNIAPQGIKHCIASREEGEA